MENLGLIFDTLGTILIGIMALRVHDKVLHDKHFDKDVFEAMRSEQHTGKVGILFVIIGFVLQIFGF